MRRVDWTGAGEAQRDEALARPPRGRDPAVAARVAEIFADVEARGEVAVADWATRLDGSPPRRVAVDAAAVARARTEVAPEDLEALAMAADAVRRFHDADRPADGAWIEAAPGMRSRRVWRPIDSVGLYVPGGTAPLFSTLLMLAIPAAVAGCPRLTVVTPPSRDGDAPPIMLLAAEAAGIDALHLVGGAQAIAALAFGAGLPRADKIFGPGNAWVAEAKRRAADLAGGPAIDLPAGPSELMVVADASADADRVAADLLSQAEHDADAQVLLATPDAALADRVEAALAARLAALPRCEAARAALANSRILLCADVAEAVEAANAYAPEHLSLQVAEPERWAASVRQAGAVFLGGGAAESFGDYLSGPSHVLPTDGAARAFSGVTVTSFMTSFTLQQAVGASSPALAAAAARLARLEGLEAHALAAELRAA